MPFGSYLLNSTANPAHIISAIDGVYLAVLEILSCPGWFRSLDAYQKLFHFGYYFLNSHNHGVTVLRNIRHGSIRVRLECGYSPVQIICHHGVTLECRLGPRLL